jgi:hypothetical protein
LAAIAEVLRVSQEFIRIRHVSRLELEVEPADISDWARKERFAEEIQREILVPGCRDILIDLQGLEAVLDNSEMVFAIVDEMVVYRCWSQRLAVAQDDGSRWVGRDDIAPLDAAGQEPGA